MTANRVETGALGSRGREHDSRSEATADGAAAPGAAHLWQSGATSDEIPPIRKAAIVLMSLEHSLASQLLSHLDRASVEAVTLEIARLERVEPNERAEILDEFYGLGLRRLCFVFDDLVKMDDADIRAAFHAEDLERWALALAGAAATVRAKVLHALTDSSASLLNRCLDRLGPFRLSDSESAQLEIAERLRRLYDRGRISLPEPTGQEEVVV
jgi:flagellar motor switch protein FliG